MLQTNLFFVPLYYSQMTETKIRCVYITYLGSASDRPTLLLTNASLLVDLFYFLLAIPMPSTSPLELPFSLKRTPKQNNIPTPSYCYATVSLTVPNNNTPHIGVCFRRLCYTEVFWSEWRHFGERACCLTFKRYTYVVFPSWMIL